jgi:hypothetical protein
MRGLLLLLLAVVVHLETMGGETLDDAVRSLAKDITAQLAPGEIAHVSERSLDPAFAAETTRARTLLDRALRRPAARGAGIVEVVVTATGNLRGPLLVAEVQKGRETVVETAGYSSQLAAPASRPALVSRLLWEQDEPILDLTLIGDGSLLVLSPSGVKLCRRSDGQCEVKEARPPSLTGRDPRGRLVVSGDAFTAHLSDGDSGEFQIDGEQVHFSPGQNTLESASGEKFFSIARAGSFRLVAGVDGRTRISQGPQTFVLDGWGSDMVGIASSCEPGPLVVATSSSESNAADSAAAYEITNQNPRAATGPVEFPGPVTALWPAAGGALAIVHQLATGRYAAYNLTLDCGR